MSDNYQPHDVTCRKRHICEGCGTCVEPGWSAITWSWVEDGYGWGRCHWHPPCYGRAQDTGALHDDGSLPLLEDDREWMGLVGAMQAWGDIYALDRGRRREPHTCEGLLHVMRTFAPFAPWESSGVLSALTRAPNEPDQWLVIGRPSGRWSTLRLAEQWYPWDNFGEALEHIIIEAAKWHGATVGRIGVDV